MGTADPKGIHICSITYIMLIEATLASYIPQAMRDSNVRIFEMPEGTGPFVTFHFLLGKRTRGEGLIVWFYICLIPVPKMSNRMIKHDNEES